MRQQAVPTMYFFGVTTAKSSSRKMFPLWADILQLEDAQLVGLDFPINAPPEDYRAAVEHIRTDPQSRGALVTTHKINVLNAARDLFDHLTPDATLCGEVSCIYKHDGKLYGHATDPDASGESMRHFIPAGHWGESNADILCFGGGGSAVAIVAHLLNHLPPDNQPRKMIIVNRTAPKLAFLRALIDTLPPSNIAFEFVQNSDPTVNDALMATLPEGSLVINATGMGKDTPGSPITDAAIFPRNGFAWELNYRGELDFMHQALRQATAQRLHVEDGWRYFLLGWSEIVGRVFDLTITAAQFDQLAQAAESVR